MWSNGMDNAKWKKQMTRAENFTGSPSTSSFLPNLLPIVQIHVWLEMGVQKQAGYLLCKQMVFDFFFFFKSLISLTPFPKIVHSFAYLQCANSAVWNSTLCRVYRRAPFSFAADGIESLGGNKVKRLILLSLLTLQKISLFQESFPPLLLSILLLLLLFSYLFFSWCVSLSQVAQVWSKSTCIACTNK